MSRLNKLVDDLKKLRGIYPYNIPSNQCYKDGYFALSIKNKYTEDEIKKAEEIIKNEKLDW